MMAYQSSSRAFAIGAYETTFYLYALKPRRRLEAELKESLVIIPVEAVSFFAILLLNGQTDDE